MKPINYCQWFVSTIPCPFTHSWPSGEQPRAKNPRVESCVNGVFGAIFSEGVEFCGSSEDFHSFSIWHIRSFLEKKQLRMINMIIWRFGSAELLEHWKSDTESFRFISMVQPMLFWWRQPTFRMFFKKPWRWTIVNPDLEVHFLHLVSSPGIVSPSANQWNNGELTADHYPVIKRDAKSYDYPYSLWTRGSSQAHDNWSPIYQQLYLLFSVLPLVLNPSDRVLQHKLEALIATILQLLFVNKMFFWP